MSLQLLASILWSEEGLCAFAISSWPVLVIMASSAQVAVLVAYGMIAAAVLGCDLFGRRIHYGTCISIGRMTLLSGMLVCLTSYLRAKKMGAWVDEKQWIAKSTVDGVPTGFNATVLAAAIEATLPNTTKSLVTMLTSRMLNGTYVDEIKSTASDAAWRIVNTTLAELVSA